LDGHGIAAAASRALNKRIQFIDCSKEDFLEMYYTQGVPRWLALGFAEILELVAANRLANLETHSFFVELTGHEPICMEDFFKESFTRFSHEGGEGTGALKHQNRKGYSSREEGYGGAEEESGNPRSPIEELRELLQELVMDKQRRVKAKREWLRREQACLNRYISLSLIRIYLRKMQGNNYLNWQDYGSLS
jgi:hypothetical protein